MVLIDAVYINQTGGLVLLEHIIDRMTRQISLQKVVFLLDDRVRNHFCNTNRHLNIIYLKGSELTRLNYYVKHKKDFNKVLCFANVPPPIKVDAEVFTYFQNALIIDRDSQTTFPWKARLSLKLKYFLIRSRLVNTDFFIVQTQNVSELLTKKFQWHNARVKVLPFYSCTTNCSVRKAKFDNKKFFYPASGHSHKNHEILLEAWINLKKTKKINGELHLTVGESFKELSEKLIRLNQEGYKVINHGVLSKERVNELYRQSNFVIHPSFCESFGLVLIESLMNECILIAPDLPYVKSIVVPNYFFDARDRCSIEKAIMHAYCGENSLESKVVITDKTEELIKLICG
jgi:glycosyltransferase involved in cell wall biosynthesis